jgi:hypothetical protein
VVRGALFVTGFPKASVVSHSDGSQRIMHALETPECWFEDVGRAQLQAGISRVDIDPDFAAVSGIAHDYHVFLTAEGPSNGLYVTDRTSTGFEVREQGEGTSGASFSYRIMTKRSGIQAGRLDPIELPSEAEEPAIPEPPEPPPVPSPAFPEQPGAVPPTEVAPEGGVPERPRDWPETVPWPPEILLNNDGQSENDCRC